MKKAQRIFGFILLTIFFNISEGTAQEDNGETQEVELWSGAKIKYEINKLWSLSLEHEYRFKDNASTMDQNFFEFGVKRNLGENFSTALGARYIRNNDTQGNIQGIENHFRWNADLRYKTDLNRFTLMSRLRYQSKSEFDTDIPLDNTFRLRIGSEYHIRNWKLDPEFSTEIFDELSNEGGLDKIRFTLGTSYKWKGVGEFTGFYRLEKELNQLVPETSKIFGIRYGYTIKNRRN